MIDIVLSALTSGLPKVARQIHPLSQVYFLVFIDLKLARIFVNKDSIFNASS